MEIFELGQYTATLEYYECEGVWSIQHRRDGRLLESVNTGKGNLATSIWWQFIDEIKTAECRRRWA